MVPRWEQAERDAPDEIAGAVATILDVRRRAADLDPSRAQDDYTETYSAILSEASYREAVSAVIEFRTANCD